MLRRALRIKSSSESEQCEMMRDDARRERDDENQIIVGLRVRVRRYTSAEGRYRDDVRSLP